MPQELPRLTAAQTAARLGVRLETVYAYVSRGLLTRERGAEGSSFDALEVERFAASRRGGGTRPATSSAGTPLMVIDTDIALVEDGRLYYRGCDIADLATGYSYESVAARVIDGTPLRERSSLTAGNSRAEGTPGRIEPLAPDPAGAAAGRRVVDALPERATLLDALRVAVTALGASDPFRDSMPAVAGDEAVRLIATMVGALPDLRDTDPLDPEEPRTGTLSGSLAALLWPKLTAETADDGRLRCLNAALVLLFDHDMAISTLAARAAASARGNIYAVLSSGMSALDSVLHGNASLTAHHLLASIERTGDAARVIAETLQLTGRGLPGFGPTAVYSGSDPRAVVLLDLLPELRLDTAARRRLEIAQETAALVTAKTGAHPSIDFALAALAFTVSLRADAGEAVFAIARSGGWIAHAVAEYRLTPLRLRPVGRYVGP